MFPSKFLLNLCHLIVINVLLIFILASFLISRFNPLGDNHSEISPKNIPKFERYLNVIHLSWSKPCAFFRFIEKLQQDIPGKGVKQQLQALCSIYALFLLHKHLGDFLSTGCINQKQGSLANELLRSLYSQVCPKQFLVKYHFLLYINYIVRRLMIYLWLIRFVLMQLR